MQILVSFGEVAQYFHFKISVCHLFILNSCESQLTVTHQVTLQKSILMQFF